MKRSKKHHFLPQFYLEGFGIPDKPTHVWKVEKTPKTRHYPVNIRDAGEMNGYHTIIDKSGQRDSNTVEQLLSDLEQEHAKVLSRIKARTTLSPQETTDFFGFVLLMDVRVPAFRDYVERLHKASFDAMNKVLLKDDRLYQSMLAHRPPQYASFPPSLVKIVADKTRKMIEAGELDIKVSNNELIRHMLHNAADDRKLDLVQRMGVTFYEAPQGMSFITGDCAVSRFFPRPLPADTPGVGFLHREIELAISLTSRLLAKLDWSVSGMRYTVATEAQVVEFNRRTIVTSDETIFSPAVEAHLLAQITANSSRVARTEISLDHDPQQGTCRMITRTIPVFPEECY